MGLTPLEELARLIMADAPRDVLRAAARQAFRSLAAPLGQALAERVLAMREESDRAHAEGRHTISGTLPRKYMQAEIADLRAAHLPTGDDPATREDYRKLFNTAVDDFVAITKALNLDADSQGIEQILAAIKTRPEQPTLGYRVTFPAGSTCVVETLAELEARIQGWQRDTLKIERLVSGGPHDQAM